MRKETTLHIENISRCYGNLCAVDQTDLLIKSGEVVGLIGPNGAGKTTLLRILVTLLKPDTGNFYLNGLEASGKSAILRKLIGYLPEDGAVYSRLSVRRNLQFYLSFYDEIVDRESEIDHWMDMFDLKHKSFEPVGKLSRGMRQKVQLIRAFIHQPEVLLLDEPFTGLDPSSRLLVRRLIETCRRKGNIVLFSSHILAEVEEICTRFLIMLDGKIKMDVNREDMHPEDEDRERFVLERLYQKLTGE